MPTQKDSDRLISLAYRKGKKLSEEWASGSREGFSGEKPDLFPRDAGASRGENRASQPKITPRTADVAPSATFQTASKGKIAVIGCGGTFSAEDAYRKIRLGASLVQFITGLIFEGPQLAAEINAGLIKLLKKDGFKNIGEAVGKDA
jgi:hypothetical protein